MPYIIQAFVRGMRNFGQDIRARTMFEIFLSEKNEQFYFRLKARNGEIIMASEAYTQKVNALNAVESVRRHSSNRSNFKEMRSGDERWYFNLVAANNQVIGTSQMYRVRDGMNKGIEAVMRVAADAGVEDLTV